MPYQSIQGAKDAGFPTKAEDIPLTIAQINHLAEIAEVKDKVAALTELAKQRELHGGSFVIEQIHYCYHEEGRWKMLELGGN